MEDKYASLYFFFCQHLVTFLLRTWNPWLSDCVSFHNPYPLHNPVYMTDKELQRCFVGWRGNLVLPLQLSCCFKFLTPIGTCWYIEAPLLQTPFPFGRWVNLFKIKVKELLTSKAIFNSPLLNSRSCSA